MLNLLRAHITTSKRYSVSVWDISIRLFHWSLVAGIGFLWFSGEEGGNIMTWHIYVGYYMLGLVTYRIIWGFIGSPYSRFSAFLAGPRQTLRYAKAFIKGEKSEHLSHNPLGGLIVILFLLLIFIQATTGLFSSDDIFTEGPLYALVSSKTGDLLTSIHHLNFKLLLASIVLHITAVFYHEIFKKEPLIKSMFTGKKTTYRANESVSKPNYSLMLLSAGIAAAGVYLLVNLS